MKPHLKRVFTTYGWCWKYEAPGKFYKQGYGHTPAAAYQNYLHKNEPFYSND